MQIREFRFPEDYPAVLSLWESLEGRVNVGRSDSLEEIKKKIQRDPELFLVAVEGSRVVGSVIGGFDGRRGLIYHLAVAEPFRERGIGTELMLAVEAGLRAKGCLRCYLMVTRENEAAMQYYRNRGWARMEPVVLFAKNLDEIPPAPGLAR